MKRRSLLSIAALLGASLVVALPIGCGETTSKASESGVKCTPGNYVFCRCQDRQEGTKLCNEDGKSFARCEPCETEDNPAIPDDPDNPPEEFDGGEIDGNTPGPAMCGDKIVQDGEDCDDGNKVEDDGCDMNCKLAGTNPLSSRSCPGMPTHVWGSTVTYVGTTVGSTNTGTAKPGPCTSTTGGNSTSGAAASDRLFHVTAHKTGQMTVTTSDTNYDCLIYVGAMCMTDNIVHLACANNTNGVGGETMKFPVQAGSSYTVVVDGVLTSQGNFRVTFSIQ